MIACVYAAHFVADIERQMHRLPRSTPLVVCAAEAGGKVLAACAAAQEYGIRPGTTQALARARCPEAVFVTAAPARYEHALDDAAALLSAWSSRLDAGASTWSSPARSRPINQQPGAAWWFLDLGAVDMAAALDLVTAITTALAEHAHVDAVVGVAPGRFAAWCAAQCDGTSYIPAAQVERQLAPLPLELLPLDESAWEWLRLLGLSTLGQLAALPPGSLETQLGGVGRLLRELARGQDRDPVPPYVPTPSLRAVRRADGAVSDRSMLCSVMSSLAAQLAARLQRRGTTARTVALQLEVEDGPPWEDQLAMEAPASQPEPLHTALLWLLGRAAPAAGVERVGVTLGGLEPMYATQLSLLDDGPQRASRGEAVARFVARFGPGRAFFATPLRPGARVPEWRFRLRQASDP